jgi:hypothetical protein
MSEPDMDETWDENEDDTSECDHCGDECCPGCGEED